MDFVIPQSFTLPDGDAAISLSYRTEETFSMKGRWVSDEVYRVIGYSWSNTSMTDSEGPLFELSLSATSALTTGDYTLEVANVCAVTENAFEESLSGASTSFEVTEEQASHVVTPLSPTLCWPTDIYDAHGRLVRKDATSFEGLSKGVYIVNNRKFVR